ncbi:aconitate hydratase AcnA [Ktedonosporobacter rubrisoli]|uniref:Aconitate hydratase n=2 Tax=Ktedonosporobacter rubrisoli TaxID=2509675 RepID=A0A4P6K636_KTERU|nr:aconitate hydratase AcnA [Ktedonosporobacter rubrisoli]
MRATFPWMGKTVNYHRLASLEAAGLSNLRRLPFTVKILLENLLRQAAAGRATAQEVAMLARWRPGRAEHYEFPFYPGRVLLQDFTGVPAVADLAAMRDAVARLGGEPERVHPLIPVDFVIDHSLQVDAFGTPQALTHNIQREFERNKERYMLLRWAQQAFDNVRVIPPGVGIVHQINLEYLASVVQIEEPEGALWAFPDTLICTDSHTPMINGLGVLGWGVGGIEAEAVMLGQPLTLQTPTVIGIRLKGACREGVTATDLVLYITQMLRRYGVVGKFVEFTGEGVRRLSLADRATIANMSPEFGATATMFPIDAETLHYLRITGRSQEHIELVERYARAQDIFFDEQTPEPDFDDLLELDLRSIEPSMAGPNRPQDRVPLAQVPERFRSFYADSLPEKPRSIPVEIAGQQAALQDGSVVIAAITSCTNTSNPAVMIAAGLLAKKAVQRGLQVKPTIKTSLAPGSRVVREYLERSGLLAYLEALRFHVVGFGCTTCCGSSGPLPTEIADPIQEHGLIAAAVLSGNRNFEGRVHQQVRASFLASPPLVVAYALAGTLHLDLTREPLGYDQHGEAVYLRDLWPNTAEIEQVMKQFLQSEMFVKNGKTLSEGDANWQALPISSGKLFVWDCTSTYIQEPPFFQHITSNEKTLVSTLDIQQARVLVSLGDSITTDHISPVGNFAASSEAGSYLSAQGVDRRDFNTYGARRGNHEVMVRGTFGNIRLRNRLTPDREGPWTRYLPSGEVLSIYQAAERYRTARIPLLVIAGKEYGCGSSRDWAAKGPALLGVRAVLAESFERIHRSNLVGMGILPLQFLEGENQESLGLTGEESYTITGLLEQPRQQVTVQALRPGGEVFDFEAIARLDNRQEINYYQQGGILPSMLYKVLHEDEKEVTANEA